ncbi:MULTISPECIES: hypothetical protein [Streptomyces]|uniref:hypothetical protein n=1 Tax=Streptomyces TaxID=1883 RepID=UPI00202136F1|nr:MULTISPECIES: hypothetical protein [Streptomyces]MCL7495536.1 hypothetical protein [Streptomyces sp. MCA2]
MKRSADTGRRRRTPAVVAAAVLAAVPMTGTSTAAAPAEAGAPAAGAGRAAAASPVGRWALKVSFEGHTYDSTVQFTPGGTAFIVGGGAGRWSRTGDGRFTFRIAEPMWSAQGDYLGRVSVDQSARLTGDTFTSSGVSRQYDADDVLTRSVQAHDTGTRS